MNLNHFAKTLYQLLTSIHAESHYEKNRSQTVVYPYLTYTFTTEPISQAENGFYIDIDIFDYGESQERIFNIESLVHSELDNKRIETEQAFFEFRAQNSNPIPTGDETIQRRNVMYHVKVYWKDITQPMPYEVYP